MKDRDQFRTPLRAKPLRVAGQSLDSQINDLISEDALIPVVVAMLVVGMAATNWLHVWLGRIPNPWMLTATAALVVAYAVFKFVQTRRKLSNLRLGRDAERAVAQYLEWFRTAGFFVFHDVPNGDANIDHVLIGPRGIYTIETKAASKPLRGECRASVIEDEVRLNGRTMGRNPLSQAKAQARWLHNFFKDAQFTAFVQPVVVIPGWFVEPFDMRAVGVWVLEPKALDAFVSQQPECITRDEVRAMGSALSSYIRAQSALG